MLLSQPLSTIIALIERPMKNFLLVFCLLAFHVAFAQTQVCPLNSNWSFGNLTHWWAYTGNNAITDANKTGNGPLAIMEVYDSNQGPPSGTIGVSSIAEYQLPSVPGIQILSKATTDPYGIFLTIPRINGYQYTNSILLGSTSITRASDGSTAGGYVRGVSYLINVPPGPTTEPYTMTYAYAMVLENGTHNSNEQPLFQATLEVGDSIITCASPKYYLPTLNNAVQGGGATLDTAAAKANGFFLSSKLSPNDNPNGRGAGATQHLQDVWYKKWTEVTFDLGPYRGRQVTLIFETDNCVPGGHFAYSYIALRNTCAGLVISGDTVACIGSTLTYSVPSLAGATYQWSFPGDWTIVGNSDSSVLQLTIGNDTGSVKAQEQNSCANLTATLPVTTAPPTIAGAVSGGTEVCTGTNSATLSLSGNRGGVLNWLALTGGNTYTSITDTTDIYTAVNLTDTTTFLAVVQNGESCNIDTATAATVYVDPLTVGGALSPANMLFCLQQSKDALLTLTGQVGKPVNWQSSPDGAAWTDFAPVYPDSVYEVPASQTQDIQYRVIVQSGVCPPQNSAPSVITIVQTPFPQATYDPADTLICYNTQAQLSATIDIGTDYAWTAGQSTLSNSEGGAIGSLPYTINTTASPLSTTDYVLNVENQGCPNPLIDTFLVQVLPPILVDAGNDTSIVINQPLQLNASSNDTTTPGGDAFSWTPSTALNNPNIFDPVATFSTGMDSVRYFVTATSRYGCTGTTSILVKVYSTPPEIFVPNAFTPGGPTNSIFRPIPVGISYLNYFRVYNRWGQLVYATSIIGDGWNGQVNGRAMDSGTYVWMVQGVSYLGKTVFNKGTMVLVR
jgi:gliding motility-associated-like protein